MKPKIIRACSVGVLIYTACSQPYSKPFCTIVRRVHTLSSLSAKSQKVVCTSWSPLSSKVASKVPAGSGKVPARFQQRSTNVPARFQARFQQGFQEGSCKVPARLQASFQQGSSKVPARFQQGSRKVPARFQEGSSKVALNSCKHVCRSPLLFNVLDVSIYVLIQYKNSLIKRVRCINIFHNTIQ